MKILLWGMKATLFFLHFSSKTSLFACLPIPPFFLPQKRKAGVGGLSPCSGVFREGRTLGASAEKQGISPPTLARLTEPSGDGHKAKPLRATLSLTKLYVAGTLTPFGLL